MPQMKILILCSDILIGTMNIVTNSRKCVESSVVSFKTGILVESFRPILRLMQISCAVSLAQIFLRLRMPITTKYIALSLIQFRPGGSLLVTPPLALLKG